MTSDDREAKEYRKILNMHPIERVRRKCLRCGKKFLSENRCNNFLCIECNRANQSAGPITIYEVNDSWGVAQSVEAFEIPG